MIPELKLIQNSLVDVAGLAAWCFELELVDLVPRTDQSHGRDPAGEGPPKSVLGSVIDLEVLKGRIRSGILEV